WEEAVPDDTLPWDDIPFPEPPPEEEESIPQEPAPRPKAAAPIPKGAPVAPVLEKASDAGDTSADGIWKRFLAALQKENLPLFVMARCANRVELSGSVLSVVYDKAGYADGLQKPAKKKILDSVMEKAAPEYRIEIRSSSGGSDDTVERAKAIFGEKLEILD
ncbi:MAG: hypothetical protein IJP37_02500, partial [Clostridia bacterium]|nr:hypothetical protein [Clostridia bacterium]